MDPIIYVAIGLQIIFVSAFVWNIISLGSSVVSDMRNNKKTTKYSSRRRSMIDYAHKNTEKVHQVQHQEVEEVVTA